MTEIRVSRYRTGETEQYTIVFSGHAAKINAGEGNILCSAISMLSQTFLQCARDLDNGKTYTHDEDIEDGYLRVNVIYPTNRRKFIMGQISFLETGIRLLQEAYPKQIHMVGDFN